MKEMAVTAREGAPSFKQWHPGLRILVGLGMVLLAGGLFLPDRILALGFSVASSTVFAVALGIIGIARLAAAGTRRRLNLLRELVTDDPLATVIATDDGEIIHSNKAVDKLFGDVGQPSVLLMLARFTESPVSLIFRLQNRARERGMVSHRLVTAEGSLRLHIRHLGSAGFLWRFEEMPELLDAQGGGIGLPMLLLSPENRILGVNKALLGLVGRRPEHLDHLFRDLPIRNDGVNHLATRSGSQRVRVAEFHRQNGQREVFLLPCENESARPITRLFEDLPVALVRLSVDGVLQQVNRQARPLLGRFREGESRLGDLVQGLGRPVSEWLREAASGRASKRPEVVQLRDADHEVYLQIALARLVENGEIFLIAVLQDATELKTLEAQFVQSQKMQAIGQLAGGVAHDFNNLLTAISGHCDLLLLRHDEGDPDYGDLIQITQNANRAASLVSQLLAFSRKQNLQPEDLDLRDTLSELSHLLNRLLGEKVVLRVDHGKDLMPVRADRRQLEQVFMNLVVNARDAMPGGGEVRIEARNLVLESEMQRDRATIPAGRYVSISVSDNGSGIPRDRIDKIFEPFFTTKKTGEGTGLGLSMVYGIVKQTGGFIFVDSALGQGSVFEILLPALEGQVRTQATPAPGPPLIQAAGAREEGVVLLVEDEAPVRSFAAKALRMQGYEVIEASDAEEALRILDDPALHVDVFVTDVIMPGKDGPTWVKEALKRRPDTRVIFVSGYAEESFSRQQAEIGNSVFLPKPFSLGDLADRVRRQMAA